MKGGGWGRGDSVICPSPCAVVPIFSVQPVLEHDYFQEETYEKLNNENKKII